MRGIGRRSGHILAAELVNQGLSVQGAASGIDEQHQVCHWVRSGFVDRSLGDASLNGVGYGALDDVRTKGMADQCDL